MMSWKVFTFNKQKTTNLVGVSLGKGGFHHAVDGRQCLGIEGFVVRRCLATRRLEASKRLLLLHEHDQDVAHLILAEDTVAVGIKEVERRLETLLDCASPCHSTHEQVFFQLCEQLIVM